MQFTSLLTALLLAAPAIVIAAPVANNNAVSAVTDVFTRDNPTCNPVFSTDAKVKAQQQKSLQLMTDLTKEYHAAEKKCPSNAITTFTKKGGDKNAKEALKKKCIGGYTKCAQKRQEANKACVVAGGKSDEGHKQAVQFCKTKAAEWRARKVPN
ncbi:hypothetical protein COCCADRAFT_7318 [Bipolaris zeicola 26-R-13]|uniref:Uncharacterized protein n=1 Tax=Cochliobolus carbonum (strain 26-R-13) TaxID=930089 RepID=W6XT02_COCC2|nr:uncharacterized protein COCCADRAFT_7318 [Bipolaris zeicola 26-R-13]EUC30697.1 hypothetical protein COCCADRAFT_7318 [Bipolaris zeicola 26-R-13]